MYYFRKVSYFKILCNRKLRLQLSCSWLLMRNRYGFKATLIFLNSGCRCYYISYFKITFLGVFNVCMRGLKTLLFSFNTISQSSTLSESYFLILFSVHHLTSSIMLLKDATKSLKNHKRE